MGKMHRNHKHDWPDVIDLRRHQSHVLDCFAQPCGTAVPAIPALYAAHGLCSETFWVDHVEGSHIRASLQQLCRYVIIHDTVEVTHFLQGC